MKIEKVNEHQIRCTLTKDDLAKHQLKISELAYGTEKAKNLFKDMMAQASYELGFEAEDIPIMIEAIPMSPDCLVLVVTKVDNPEELDTRFAKFLPQSSSASEEFEEMLSELAEREDDVLDLFRRIQETGASKQKASLTQKVITQNSDTDEINESVSYSVMYDFDTLSQLPKLGKMSESLYDGKNSLYKDAKNSRYILVVTNLGCRPSDFNKICNMLSEYGEVHTSSTMAEAFLEEHYQPILVENALQTLANM